MISLDGVMQAPGGPEEDQSGGFKFGGWVAPYSDEKLGAVMQRRMTPADLLLGRETFDIWENYWPQHASGWPGINDVTKYVLSSTKKKSGWQNCVFLDSLAAIKKLKDTNGDPVKVWGSSKLVQLLFNHELVDELQLNIYPLVLGKGKRLFDDGAAPAAFRLTEQVVTSQGIILADYTKDGDVKTGRIGE